MNNEQIRSMHLFAGAGGGILADLILGHEPVVAVEWDKYACSVLRERVNDGWFDGMSVWEGDVRMFDASEYKGRVDCIHAGFPCQDISCAGNQAGVGEDTRSGLYREVLRIADEIRPRFIFLENVAAIVTGDDGAMLRTVIGDLAERGYDAVWTCLSASEVGANHKRDRWWLLGYPNNDGASSTGDFRVLQRELDGEKEEIVKPQGSSPTYAKSEQCDGAEHPSEHSKARQGQSGSADRQTDMADTNGSHAQGMRLQGGLREGHESDSGCTSEHWQRGWWEAEPSVGRVANGIPSAAHRLKALGNAQVPLQCATAFKLLWEIMIQKSRL